MRCTNSKCGKEFKDPLMLYDGKWLCPHCKNSIDPDSKFEVTKENHELFTLAQINYLRALKTEDRELRKKYIAKTVEFCDKALKLKHPEAYVLKGYLYDKDYVDLNLSESTRCKIAYKYYSAVCYAQDTNIQVEADVDHVDLEAVKKEAAIHLMIMLSNFEESEKSGNEYKFDFNMKKLRDRNIHVDVKKKTELNSVDRVSSLYSVIANCNKNYRAPLFGYYYLEGKELVELFKRLDEGSEDVKKVLYKDVNFSIVQFDKKDDIIDEANAFEKISGRDRIMRERILNHMESNPEQKMFVVLINTKKNGHQYLKKNQLDQIERYIQGERFDYDIIRNIINNSEIDNITFYDDDIYYFMNSKINAIKAVDELKIKLEAHRED